MCKIFIIAGIKDKHRAAAVKFTKKMAEIMTPMNDDGMGYAAVDKDGTLFAERWHNTKEAFAYDAKDDTIATMFSKAIKLPTKGAYNTFGVPDLNTAVAITLHARFATSGKTMENTHPFIDPVADTSLIHNGVISNVKDFKFELSTCDSEAILIAYLKNQVNTNMDGMKNAAKMLQGYYACGMFSRDESNARILDVFKGNNNDLHIAFIDELNTWVMASREDHIKEAAKALNYRCGVVFPMHDGYLLRINPVTGLIINSREFDVRSQYYQGGDYSRHNGAREYDFNTGRTKEIGHKGMGAGKFLSKEEIDYTALAPKLVRYSEREVEEYLAANGMA